MRVDEIKGQEAAKRALEIAVTGDHSIVLVAGPGQGKTSLLEAFAAIGGRTVPEYWHAEEPGVVWACLGADIVVSMADLPPADWVLPPPAEADEQIEERVRLAGTREPVDPEAMHHDARALLAQAFERLQLSPGEAARVQRVAATIARMAGADHIRRIDLAEALAYHGRRPEPRKEEVDVLRDLVDYLNVTLESIEGMIQEQVDEKLTGERRAYAWGPVVTQISEEASSGMDKIRRVLKEIDMRRRTGC